MADKDSDNDTHPSEPDGSESSSDRLNDKPLMRPRRESLERLRAYIKEERQRAQAVRNQLDAVKNAGRKAIDATNRTQDLCAAVEATLLPDEHRALLIDALRLTGTAIGELASIRPIRDPAAWILDKSSNTADQASAKAGGLRANRNRYSEFSRLLADSLLALRVRAQTIGHIQAELGELSSDDLAIPEALAAQCDATGRLLTSMAQQTDDGGSLVAAWNQACLAQDILDGAVLLFEPTLREYPWPDLYQRSAAMCLSVIGGAVIMTRGMVRLSA